MIYYVSSGAARGGDGTEIEGFMSILHGDMRFYNNVFVQRPIRPVNPKPGPFEGA